MLVFPDSSVGKESACNAGDPGSIPDPGQEVPLEKEEATHSSILSSIMDYRVQGIAKSRT